MNHVPVGFWTHLNNGMRWLQTRTFIVHHKAATAEHESGSPKMCRVRCTSYHHGIFWPYSLKLCFCPNINLLQSWTSFSLCVFSKVCIVSFHRQGETIWPVKQGTPHWIWSLVNYNYFAAIVGLDTNLLDRASSNTLCSSVELMLWGCLRKLCREAGTGRTMCFHKKTLSIQKDHLPCTFSRFAFNFR